MNKEKLKYMLDKLNVYSEYYSLEGNLLPDRIVLSYNYRIWEVFYFDERGNRDNKRIFFSENDACNYVYEYLKKTKGNRNRSIK